MITPRLVVLLAAQLKCRHCKGLIVHRLTLTSPLTSAADLVVVVTLLRRLASYMLNLCVRSVPLNTNIGVSRTWLLIIAVCMLLVLSSSCTFWPQSVMSAFLAAVSGTQQLFDVRLLPICSGLVRLTGIRVMLTKPLTPFGSIAGLNEHDLMRARLVLACLFVNWWCVAVRLPAQLPVWLCGIGRSSAMCLRAAVGLSRDPVLYSVT